MYGKLEGLGTRLLGLFVPKVEAAAACRTYSYCWQCDGCCYACCTSTYCYWVLCAC